MGQINDDLFVNGGLSSRSFKAAAGSIDNTAIQASAGITATKLQQQRVVTLELFESTTDCAALTKTIGSVMGLTGTLVSFKALVTTKATTDKTVVLDLKRAAAGGSFATMLTGTFAIGNSDTNLTFKAGTLASSSLVVGDLFQVVVTVTAGTGGNQNKGLVVQLVFTEDPA